MPEKISVAVTLRSILARFRPEPKNREPFELEVDENSTVGDVLAARSIPPQLAHLVFVDRVRSDHDTALHDGARVDIYPPIAGG